LSVLTRRVEPQTRTLAEKSRGEEEVTMPQPGERLRKMGFLTIGRFDEDDPGPGHEETLRMIERAEALGFDTVWIRQRHLQPGISSPVAMLAAATQRTSRIELGTAVIPLGPENPLRLAEDLATVDVLSGGRLCPGVSVGTPVLYDNYKTALYPETHEVENFTKDRVTRLLDFLRGVPVSDFEGALGIEQFSRRVEPHSPGLAERVWYGAASLSSAIWAAEQGMNFLSGNVVSSAGTDARDFAAIQALQMDAYRAHHRNPENARISQGLVVIPTDSATAEQIEKYRAYAAARLERTTTTHGPRGMMFSPDYVGTSDELADALYRDAGFLRADDVAFALPFTFDEDDYVQIVTDMAEKLGPKLGWNLAEEQN
jgi:alkanesulfonate monooxygenase SsuD/methylene tetrahydromethanopterin reductase-like flavin-dependent oxidoreductase (luciferase family)